MAGGRSQDRDKRDGHGKHGDERKQEEAGALATHAPPRVESLKERPSGAILCEVSLNPDRDLGVSR